MSIPLTFSVCWEWHCSSIIPFTDDKPETGHLTNSTAHQTYPDGSVPTPFLREARAGQGTQINSHPEMEFLNCLP